MDKQIKWFTPISSDGERELKQHAFKGGKFLKPITGIPYEGNRALCTNRIKLSEEGPRILTFDEIDGEFLNEDNVCKKCYKMAYYNMNKEMWCEK